MTTDMTAKSTFLRNLLVLSAASVAAAKSTGAKFLKLPLIPHEHVVRRHMAEGNDPDGYYHNATLEVGGLYQGYGTHYVDLWVGTPPQRQTVIVDTGSGITAFPCSGCSDCGHDYHASDFFVESASNSLEKFSCSDCVGGACTNRNTDNQYCHLSVSYQEGSMWSAYEARDVTYVGGLHDSSLTKNKEDGSKMHSQVVASNPEDAADFEFNMVFGCQTKITGLFKTQLADGIMGMCIKSSAIWAQMYAQNIIDSQSFSLCFMRADDAEKGGTVAGALTMGGTDTDLHLKPMVYANGFVTKGVMHGVNIRKIWLMNGGNYNAVDAAKGNTHLVKIADSKLNYGSVIVDSGTTDTYMTNQLKEPFKAAFKEAAGFEYKSGGMNFKQEDVDKLPTILIQLGGHPSNPEFNPDDPASTPGLAGNIDPEFPNDILVAIPPAHYIEFDTGAKKYVGRFTMTERRGSVLGANTIRGHDTLFDIPDNGRIGFAPSDCDYLNLIGEEEDEVVESNKESQGYDDYYGDSDENNGYNFTYARRGVPVFALVGFLMVSVVAIAVIIYRHRRQAQYHRTAVATDVTHLSELHLDTEIQMTQMD